VTINQINQIFSGKGLGVFDSLYNEDLTNFGYVDENGENSNPNKVSWIYYKA